MENSDWSRMLGMTGTCSPGFHERGCGCNQETQALPVLEGQPMRSPDTSEDLKVRRIDSDRIGRSVVVSIPLTGMDGRPRRPMQLAMTAAQARRLALDIAAAAGEE